MTVEISFKMQQTNWMLDKDMYVIYLMRQTSHFQRRKEGGNEGRRVSGDGKKEKWNEGFKTTSF